MSQGLIELGIAAASGALASLEATVKAGARGMHWSSA